MNERIRIFAALGEQEDLSRGAGDVYNEIETYKKLSSFADVHYNGFLLDWNKPNLGIKRKKLEIPNEHFDLYYFRNSPRLHESCPGPLIMMGYPYDEELWKTAEGIVVTTHSWKQFVSDYNTSATASDFEDPWYPEHIHEPRNILVFEQSIKSGFINFSQGKTTKMYRAGFGEGFIIGFLGRIDPTCYPHDVVAAVKEIRKTDQSVSLTLMGNIKDLKIPDWIQVYRRQPLEQMPGVVSAFDCLIYDQDETGHYFGSIKCLEAMAIGIPILVRPYPARIEQFGDSYPLYYRDAQEAELLIVRLKNDPKFKEKIKIYLIERREKYIQKNVEKRIEAEVIAFLESLN